jgi:WD repeat-containing protein 35
MMWATDNPQLFAMMEKTRMYIFRGMDPEEPVLSSGYMAEFKDLRVKSIMLDDIMANPDHPDKGFVIDYETRSIRDTRHLLVSNRIPDAMQFIEDNSHPVSTLLLPPVVSVRAGTLRVVVCCSAFVAAAC